MPYFENSNNVVINNSSFVDVTYRGAGPNLGESCCSACGSWLGADDDDEGWYLLTHASLFNAAHDSAAQDKLHQHLPATRHGELIDELDDLVSGRAPCFRALVLNGPRSNLAHLCAKRLEDKLCTSFFVSQSLQTDDDVRLFPTIAWQLAIQFPAYRTLLQSQLRRDASILHKTLEIQFRELIADPFRELLQKDELILGERKVIVIAGLEEYPESQTRLKLLRLILRGAGELPFIWLIFSRPDPPFDTYVVEMEPTVQVRWGEGYPALQEQTHSLGTDHAFLLLHSRSRFIVTPNFRAKNIATVASFFFF